MTPVRDAVRPPRINPIRNRAHWESQRKAFLEDPGAFFGGIARATLHWYDEKLDTWITWDDKQGRWIGLGAKDGAAVDVPYGAEHAPWARAFDGGDPPFYRWFSGGRTNACFNEVDRHVLMGHGDEVAFHFEGDRWDSSLNGGRGGPVVSFSVTRKRLLLEVVKAAQVLVRPGAEAGRPHRLEHAQHHGAVLLHGGGQAPRHRLHAGVRRFLRQDALRPHPQRRRQGRHHQRRLLPQRADRRRSRRPTPTRRSTSSFRSRRRWTSSPGPSRASTTG